MKLFLNVLLMLSCALTTMVYAAEECSVDYIGKATLNEIFVKHQGGGQSRGYLEVKILDGSSTAEYDNWKVKICTQSSCSTLPLSSANDSNLPWIYFDKNDFDINLIDFDNGFDLSLLDVNDNFIDYISIGGVDRQNFGVSCHKDDLPYDFPIPGTGTGTKLLHRTPDGVGSWTALSANNGETPGDGNTDPTNNPLLIISDDSVMQGQNENFTISVQDYFGNPAYSLDDIVIVYYTTNDSAISPEHYSGKGNTPITIPAGFNSVTIPIETVFVGDQVTRRFYLQYSADVFVSDNLGVGTIIPLPGAVLGPLALYRFEQTDLSSQIDDTSGNNNHAEIPFIGASLAEGKYCRGFDSVSYNRFDYTGTAFRSELDLDGDVGLQGTVSFWFNSTVNWNDDFERVLFDASSGSNAADKYFVLEIQENGRLKFAFEDSNDSDFSLIEPSTNSRQADTWYYLTVTWDYLANDFAIYVDGNLQIQQTKNTNGAMGELGKIVFGDNSSDYTQIGNSPIASPYSSRGNYDETRIYNKVLTQTEIIADMNDDNGCAAELIAEWRMDENAWGGVSGEVKDETGNFNSQAINGATTARLNPAIAGNPGTCGYGTFDGVNDYVALPASFENQQESFSITAWINPSNLDQGSRIFADDESNTQGYAFSLGDPGSGKLRFYSRGVSPISVDTSSSVIPVDTWTFVTVVHDSVNKTRKIYVNGVAQTVTGGGISNTYSGTWGIDTGIASIGGETNSGEKANRFTGAIDEVRMYKGALTSAEIVAIYNETHPCESYIDHFQIDTKDQQGITCQADEITIKACADASCDTVNAQGGLVRLNINGDFYKEVAVSGSEGTTTSYPYTTVGNAVLSLDETYDCTNNLDTTSCTVNFKDSGFIISDIPMQISGKPSGEGFNATTLSLRAVETNTTTGACMGAFPDGGDISVNLSYTCHGDSSACINNLILNNNSSDKNITKVATSQDLRFTTDSTANFSLTYPDAGKLILNAQKDVEVIDNDGNKTIKDFSVSSNAFVERPFAFKVDFLSDTNSANAFAQDASGNPDASKTPFKKAGETFKLTATAVQWKSGQDSSPYDGIPDDFSAISANLTAENFADGPLTIIDELLLPKVSDGGTAGTLVTELSNNFVNSIITNEYNYSEVGILKLNVNLFDGDYLGAGDILGEVNNVGRFTPAYFIQTVDSHGDLNAYHYDTCSPITNDWAYAGQTRDRSGSTVGAISYSLGLAPIIHITAYNLSGSSTKNYTESGFMKLTASGITIPVPIADDAVPRLHPTVPDEKVLISASMLAGDAPVASVTKGVVTYVFNELDHFTYEHNKHSKLAPFTANIPFLVTEVEDTDLVTLYDGSDSSITVTEKVITGGLGVRFGRWSLENSYGPETSQLPVTMFSQHFDGSNFINNDKESCLVPAVGTKITTGNIGDAGMNLWEYRLVDLDGSDALSPDDTDASFSDINQTFVSGLYRWLLFSDPGNTKQGSLEVEYQVPPWLQYDWNGDSNFINNPTATLTFGIYRGNDRIIYQREIEKRN